MDGFAINRQTLSPSQKMARAKQIRINDLKYRIVRLEMKLYTLRKELKELEPLEQE